jgi:hypothetical protein
MCPGQHLGRLGWSLSPAIGRWLWRSVRTRSGQQLGIRGIGRGSRDVVAIAVPRRGQRNDREHLLPGLVHQMYVVMVFCPVVSDEQHQWPPSVSVRMKPVRAEAHPAVT